MQSILYIASNSPPIFHVPWKPHKTHILSPSQTLPIIHKPLTISNSLKTSFEEEKLDKSDEPSSLARLPVVIRRSGSVSRYLWDGRELKLVSVDGNSFSLTLDFEDGFRRLFRICSSGLRNFFLPGEVCGNYLEYVKWKFLHRVFSSALQVLATQTAVHRSFAVADNLGEVSAKAQIQTVCFDNLGLMLAAALNILFRNNLRLQASLPFVVYPIFSAIDLIGIYQGLKHVHLQTLTKDRLEIIINTWIQLGCVPSPADVSEEEGIDFMWSKGRGLWPIRIGCLNPRSQLPRLSMMTMQSLNDEDFYFICLEILCSGVAKTWQQGILICVREGAGTADIITGLLQACHIRKAILSSVCKWESILEAPDSSDSVSRHWFQLIEDSKRIAQRDFNLLNEQMLGLGWACKNILLSTQEQARYSFVDD
ncbi:Protein root UVB sensitive 4 [Camellia lanceoleosa]|uniref:Protein root UVB sensitive 4 n=1 Tax=Camellia lanceoleosa TaxID=1840588 RepID=A0ACC0IXK9_9ERIC|nr:Protein root UVB sensitive 4 [Camellia lanceoleosa]